MLKFLFDSWSAFVSFINKGNGLFKLYITSALFFFQPLLAVAGDNLEERVSKLEEQLHKSLSINATEQTSEEKRLRTIYDDGFYLKGADDTLKIGGWLQAGYRAIDKKDIGVNEFFIRRARLDIRGVLEENWGYRIYGAFEGSSAKLQEGWLEYRWGNPLRVRLGQIKPPYSLETSYSARWTPLIERSLATTNLSVSEDIGLMIFGNLFKKKASYALSVYNGNGKNMRENNSNKEVAGRVTVSPFREKDDSLWKNLTVGGSLAKGRVDGALSKISYKTASRVSFVTFPITVSQRGTLLKYAGELEWFFKQFKLMSEYLVLRRSHVIEGSVDRPITSRSWFITVSCLLTGENAVSNKTIVPHFPIDKGKGSGAWELVVRYEELKTTTKAFDDGVISGARDVKSETLGLNWWPNRHVRGALNLVRTDFGEKLTFGDLSRDHENALITQFQFNF